MRRKLATRSVLWIGLLPASRMKNWMLRFAGYSISAGAEIGPVVIWKVADFSAAAGSRIGAFNVFRDLNRVVVGSRATVGSWNWISAAVPFLSHLGATGELVLGEDSAITSRHYIDCSGGVEVGRFSIVAGQRSTILTHGIDFTTARQTSEQVKFGDYSFVSTNCTVLKGATLPSKSILAAGAVLSRAGQDNDRPGLWGGVPARWIKSVDGHYFERETAYVEVESQGDVP